MYCSSNCNLVKWRLTHSNQRYKNTFSRELSGAKRSWNDPDSKVNHYSSQSYIMKIQVLVILKGASYSDAECRGTWMLSSIQFLYIENDSTRSKFHMALLDCIEDSIIGMNLRDNSGINLDMAKKWPFEQPKKTGVWHVQPLLKYHFP
jgi:hypothetical protein